jgi:hypothetical protein
MLARGGFHRAGFVTHADTVEGFFTRSGEYRGARMISSD